MKAGRLVEHDDSKPPPSGIRIVFDADTYRALEPLPDLSSHEGEDDGEVAPESKRQRPVSNPFLDPAAMRTFKTSSSFRPCELDSKVARPNGRVAISIAVAAIIALLPVAYLLAQR